MTRYDPIALFDSPEDDNPNLLSYYFNEVGNHDNLSREDQDRLYKELDQLCPTRMADSDEPIPENCQPIVDRLASHLYKLVISVARHYNGQGVAFADLIQEGNLGLLRGIWKFDPGHDVALTTYATWWIRQAVSRAIACQGRTIRLPVHQSDRWKQLGKATHSLMSQTGEVPTRAELAEALGVKEKFVANLYDLVGGTETASLDKVIQGEDSEKSTMYSVVAEEQADVINDVILGDQQAAISEALETLSIREQKVIELRFGLNGSEERTLQEVGEMFGLTRERIRQIEARALQKLRHPRRVRKLRGFLDE